MRIRRRIPPARFLGACAATLPRVLRDRWRRGPRRPGWDLGFEWLVAALRRDVEGIWRHSPREIRRHFERLARPSAWLRGVRIEPARAKDVAVAWFEPPDPMPGRVLLHFRGGAFQYGSIETNAAHVAALATLSNVTALAVDYRLAPEHPWPAALEDARTVWRWLVDHHVESRHIVVCGESAGGNLALATLQALRDSGAPLPAGAALVSPWLDLAASAASYERNADSDWGSREMLLAQARAYAGSLPLDDPRVSPGRGDPRRLPPLLVQCGSAELLFDECVEFATRAREAGVDVVLEVLPEMPHAAPLFGDLVREGARGRFDIARFVRARLSDE